MTSYTPSLYERACWATLASLRLAINPAWVIERIGSPEELFRLSPQEIAARLGWPLSRAERLRGQDPQAVVPTLERFLQEGGVFLSYADPAYPPLLKQISSPPAALWCLGDPSALLGPGVAIVGTRLPSAYGLEVATFLSRGLAERGIVVLSGGAHGIDAAAHHGALEVGGRSVAVFGTGIDKVYPRDHSSLFQRIEKQGACVTEFSPSAGPRPENFPIRNRLISGLSLAVVVIEAGEKSGALITARFAIDQNRELMAVPGSIFSASSRGTHHLLRNGALLVGSVDDILREIAAHLPAEASIVANSPAPSIPLALEGDLAVLYDLLERPASLDELVNRSQLSVSTVSHLLLELEISGVVVSLPGQKYGRSSPSARRSERTVPSGGQHGSTSRANSE